MPSYASYCWVAIPLQIIYSYAKDGLFKEIYYFPYNISMATSFMAFTAFSISSSVNLAFSDILMLKKKTEKIFALV